MSAKKNDVGLWEIEIDGKKYEFEKWGADDSLDILLDIAKIVGKPLGAAFGAFVGEDGKVSLDRNLDPNLVSLIFEALTERFDKGTVKPIIKKLCSDKVHCDGKQIRSFNEHYADDLLHMFRVTQAALEVQYGNFFGALFGIVGSRKTKPVTNQVHPA